MPTTGNKIQHIPELDDFRKYLKSDENEDAKRPLLFPLFKKLFKEKFKTESSANGADVYIEGQLLVESKSEYSQWPEGFYQALHYYKRYGLAYSTIMVVAHEFVGIWKVNKIPEFAVILSHTADAHKAPNEIGRENARKTQKAHRIEIKDAAQYWLEPKDLVGDIFEGSKNLTTESHEVLKILNNLSSDRLQINTHNFIQVIERMRSFFKLPIDAVHAFYTIVNYWDITSTVAINEENGEVRVIGFKGSRASDLVNIAPRHNNDFKKFVESQYIFTNEGSGLTVDYYFSRFDEVMAAIDEEYVKQHGIFFTDANLSKFALWFAKYHFPGKINEDYIVFDPAGGSGNLISSWKGKLKHKIISELQPDLLRIIERRMKADPFEVVTGFTIIPKTSSGTGLNFIDHTAANYLKEVKKELADKNVSIDKPIAFLLNPPYKNTDENVKEREGRNAEYEIDSSILSLTGEDAGKERYLAFLGQILNISKEEYRLDKKLKSVVMIFTPTSWLIPRPTYQSFRRIWDQHFKFHSGFLITSNEFFKIDGKWPLAFTIWIYDENDVNENSVKVYDLTHLKKPDLNINWNEEDKNVDFQLNGILSQSKIVKLDNSRGDIRDTLPDLEKNGKLIRQPRYDFSHAKKEKNEGKIVSGFPLSFYDGHFKLKRICGSPVGAFVGFMDNLLPVRISQDSCKRMSLKPDRVWFRLDDDFKGINKINAFSGSPDNRSFCAYDLESAKAIFTWFAIAKTLAGNYPTWSNQFSLWPPIIKPLTQQKWYTLCCAYVLAKNDCVVTKFEKDNPVLDTPEIFVDNPLGPTNKESFWNTILNPYITENEDKNSLSLILINKITELYKYWNLKYCKGQFIKGVGLQNEPYFKYFEYEDFLTPYSGLVQIRKYAEINAKTDLQDHFSEIAELTKKVKDEIYRMLVKDFKYFE